MGARIRRRISVTLAALGLLLALTGVFLMRPALMVAGLVLAVIAIANLVRASVRARVSARDGSAP